MLQDSKTEQKLLHILVENCGIIQSRTKLIDRIWTDGLEYVDENALSVTIKRLRDKLGAQNGRMPILQQEECRKMAWK